MTRETKLGLIVSGSFVCLLGALVAHKMWNRPSADNNDTKEPMVAKVTPARAASANVTKLVTVAPSSPRTDSRMQLTAFPATLRGNAQTLGKKKSKTNPAPSVPNGKPSVPAVLPPPTGASNLNIGTPPPTNPPVSGGASETASPPAMTIVPGPPPTVTPPPNQITNVNPNPPATVPHLPGQTMPPPDTTTKLLQEQAQRAQLNSQTRQPDLKPQIEMPTVPGAPLGNSGSNNAPIQLVQSKPPSIPPAPKPQSDKPGPVVGTNPPPPVTAQHNDLLDLPSAPGDLPPPPTAGQNGGSNPNPPTQAVSRKKEKQNQSQVPAVPAARSQSKGSNAPPDIPAPPLGLKNNEKKSDINITVPPPVAPPKQKKSTTIPSMPAPPPVAPPVIDVPNNTGSETNKVPQGPEQQTSQPKTKKGTPPLVKPPVAPGLKPQQPAPNIVPPPKPNVEIPAQKKPNIPVTPPVPGPPNQNPGGKPELKGNVPVVAPLNPPGNNNPPPGNPLPPPGNPVPLPNGTGTKPNNPITVPPPTNTNPAPVIVTPPPNSGKRIGDVSPGHKPSQAANANEKVHEFDVRRVLVDQKTLTFAALSQANYGSPRYGNALQKFYQDRKGINSNLQQSSPRLKPGDLVEIPKTHVLEERYPNLVPKNQPIPSTPPIEVPVRTAASLNNTQTTPAISVGPSASSPRAGMQTASAKQRVVSQENPRWVKARPSTSQAPRASGQTYVVRQRQGEMLFEIARDTLGDAYRWHEIYRLNPRIQPEFPIPAGTQLRLP